MSMLKPQSMFIPAALVKPTFKECREPDTVRIGKGFSLSVEMIFPETFTAFSSRKTNFSGG